MDEFQRVALFVDGQRIDDGGVDAISLTNPATGETIGQVAQAGGETLAMALDAAQRGFAKWSSFPALQRAQVLRAAAQTLRARADSLAHVMTIEQGKPLGESRAEIMLSADCLDWAAEECRRTYGRVVPSRAPEVSQVVHKFPIGPVAAFSPWNFPAFSPMQKIAPALAAGCSMILKPASETPATAVAIAEILSECGLPAGALNIVHGRASLVSETLIASPIIRKVSLTGSVEVGRTLAQLSGRYLKKCTMELGGHAPVLVLDDADVERIAPLASAAKYRNAGQVCTSPTRFIVDESVYDRFVGGFVQTTNAISVGDGLAEGTRMGPLVNQSQVEKMQELAADAEKRGGRISVGGHKVGNRGSFFAPTVIEDAPDDAKVLSEEPFGPIAVIRRVRGIDEAVAMANALPYGLASYAFTRNANAVARLTREIETGMLAFNQFQAGSIEAPFGGVKDSGFGSEGGTEGIEGYLQPKYVSYLAV